MVTFVHLRTRQVIYKLHKGAFKNTLKQLARGILRDEAAKHASIEFFHNRTLISNNMRATMEAEATKRQIKITGFQIRNVVLPPKLVSNLINVQIRRQDARAGEEQLVLETIYARSNATELRLNTSRTKAFAEYEQQSKVFVSHETQVKLKEEAETKQHLTRVHQNKNAEIAIYQSNTDIEEEKILLNISVEEETTRQLVDKLQIESETDLTVYNQETENLKLEYENTLASIQEKTKQQVAEINAATEKEVKEFQSNLRVGLAQAKSAARELLAEIKEQAANSTVDARAVALSGLPSAVYMAQTMADGAIPHVRFLDAKMTELVSTASEHGHNATRYRTADTDPNATITRTFQHDASDMKDTEANLKGWFDEVTQITVNEVPTVNTSATEAPTTATKAPPTTTVATAAANTTAAPATTATPA